MPVPVSVMPLIVRLGVRVLLGVPLVFKGLEAELLVVDTVEVDLDLEVLVEGPAVLVLRREKRASRKQEEMLVTLERW